MAKNSKKIVFKSAVFILTLFTALALTFTATYSRCITETDHNIGFKAKAQPQILFNGANVKNRTLISLWNWEQGVEQINGKFNLSAQGLSKNEGVDFYIRAFVSEDAILTNNQPENSEQQVLQPIEVSLTLGDHSYNSVPSVLDAEAYYNTNAQTDFEGYVYRFCDNVSDEDQTKEHVFHLENGENNNLDFILNIYETEILSDKIYVCIEIIK